MSARSFSDSTEILPLSARSSSANAASACCESSNRCTKRERAAESDAAQRDTFCTPQSLRLFAGHPGFEPNQVMRLVGCSEFPGLAGILLRHQRGASVVGISQQGVATFRNPKGRGAPHLRTHLRPPRDDPRALPRHQEEISAGTPQGAVRRLCEAARRRLRSPDCREAAFLGSRRPQTSSDQAWQHARTRIVLLSSFSERCIRKQAENARKQSPAPPRELSEAV